MGVNMFMWGVKLPNVMVQCPPLAKRRHRPIVLDVLRVGPTTHRHLVGCIVRVQPNVPLIRRFWHVDAARSKLRMKWAVAQGIRQRLTTKAPLLIVISHAYSFKMIRGSTGRQVNALQSPRSRTVTFYKHESKYDGMRCTAIGQDYLQPIPVAMDVAELFAEAGSS